MRKLLIMVSILMSAQAFASTSGSCYLYKQTFSDEIVDDVKLNFELREYLTSFSGTVELDDYSFSVALEKGSNEVRIHFVDGKKIIRYSTFLKSDENEQKVFELLNRGKEYTLFCK